MQYFEEVLHCLTKKAVNSDIRMVDIRADVHPNTKPGKERQRVTKAIQEVLNYLRSTKTVICRPSSPRRGGYYTYRLVVIDK